MKRYSIYIIFSIIASVSMLSCGEEYDFLNSAKFANGARVKFYHAAVDVPGVTVFVNDQLISGVLTVSPATPGLVTYGNFFPLQEYSVLTPGTANIKAVAATTPEISFTTALQVDDNKYYTVYAIGNGGSYKFVVSNDDISTPDVDKTYIRYVNAMATTPAAGVEFLVNNVVVATSSGSVDGTEAFFPYAQDGTARFTIGIREKGKTTNLTTSSALNLARGRKYTIVARGLHSSTATATRPTLTLISNTH
jgi:hypothetical protein